MQYVYFVLGLFPYECEAHTRCRARWFVGTSRGGPDVQQFWHLAQLHFAARWFVGTPRSRLCQLHVSYTPLVTQPTWGEPHDCGIRMHKAKPSWWSSAAVMTCKAFTWDAVQFYRVLEDCVGFYCHLHDAAGFRRMLQFRGAATFHSLLQRATELNRMLQDSATFYRFLQDAAEMFRIPQESAANPELN